MFSLKDPHIRRKITYTLCSHTIRWKRTVRTRDNNRCQICGEPGELVHHKIPFNDIIDLYQIRNITQASKCKLLWDTNWGITLCYKCNNLIEGNRVIVYKWVIKKEGKYYPLRNFRIDTFFNNHPPYEIGKSYTTECKIKSPNFIVRNVPNSLTRCIGYHFWKQKENELLPKWNKFLDRYLQPKINACLECEIKTENIFKENDYQLVAQEFKVLKEIVL